jgi:hypothetical protein
MFKFDLHKKIRPKHITAALGTKISGSVEENATRVEQILSGVKYILYFGEKVDRADFADEDEMMMAAIEAVKRILDIGQKARSSKGN